MRLSALVLVLAAGALVPTATAAQPARLVQLPGVEALPAVPPLAPPQPPVTEVPRLRGTVTARNRVLVGMAPDGTATSVAVVQRLSIRSLGDYNFFIPAPALSVAPATGSESRPGLRQNQLVWQGFSPRRKLLAARAELRPGGSVPALPLRVRITGAPTRAGRFELAITVVNATGTRAQAVTGDAARADVARALAALRASAEINRPVEGEVVRATGKTATVTVDVRAPLQVRGSVAFPAGAVRGLTPTTFSRQLGGDAFRLTIRGVALRRIAPKVRIVARPLLEAAVASEQTLRAAFAAYLRYFRTRQYESFLANPDPRGPSSTTYVYETAELRRTPDATAASDDDEFPTAIVLGGLALLGLGGLVVLWAHL